MSLQAIDRSQEVIEPAEETILRLARIAYGRYHSVCEQTSAELMTVTTPDHLIRVLGLLRHRLELRLATIPTPPASELQRQDRQTFEGRIKKIDEDIVFVRRSFALDQKEVR